MIETEFTKKVNGNTLAGTICLPQSVKPCPIVLFIHGSGPVDRNENARGFKSDIFGSIANHLVKYGIGSLRYDKRGCGRSTGDYISANGTDKLTT